MTHGLTKEEMLRRCALPPIQMTPEEAMETVRCQRKAWLLLAFEPHDGLWYPIYMCGRCFSYRVILVSDGAVLPEECPKCKAPLTLP